MTTERHYKDVLNKDAENQSPPSLFAIFINPFNTRVRAAVAFISVFELFSQSRLHVFVYLNTDGRLILVNFMKLTTSQRAAIQHRSSCSPINNMINLLVDWSQVSLQVHRGVVNAGRRRSDEEEKLLMFNSSTKRKHSDSDLEQKQE